MKSTTILWCAAAVAACASTVVPTAAEEVRLAEARRLLDSDPAGTLTITDGLLAQNPGLRDARLLNAEGSLRLAKNGGSYAHQLLLDAQNDFEKALAGIEPKDEPEAFVKLAETRYELGEWESGSSTAQLAADGFAATNTQASKTRAAEAVLLAARCDLQRFVEARRTELAEGKKDSRGRVTATPETLQFAKVAAQRFADVRSRFPGEAVTQTAVIFQWLGQDGAVAEELERGIRSTPRELAIHDAYIDWMTKIGQHDAMVGAYRAFVREAPDVPMLRWCQGRALFARADRLRREGNFQGASDGYGKASQQFGEYLAMMPAHAPAANQWIALCELSMTRCAVDLGDLRGAESHLFTAIDQCPLTASYENGQPQLVDSFGNHCASAAFAIHRALAESGGDALARTLSFDEAVLQRCPDRWGFAYNNAALAARDLGVREQKNGNGDAARELWERSYRYYEKAVELSPEDARIANDCGLMLVYHLHRDLDRARELFDRAIAIGEEQLAAMPSEANTADRETLEEAVGDAWQNTAVLLRDHRSAPFEAYRPFLEKAVRYYPYQRREAAALLRDGGRTGAALPASTQGGAADALAKAKPEVDAKVSCGDLDGALVALDGVAAACRDYAPYHLLRGDLTLQLARASRDGGRRGADLMFVDAVSALTRAVELDAEPNAPRQMLAEAMYEAGQLDDAVKTASALLLHLQSQGGGGSAEVLAAHTVRANAAARAYSTRKAGGEDDAELLTAARASFRALEEKDLLTPEQRTLWCTTEQWAGAPAQAVDVLVRALAKTPDDQTLLGAIVQTAESQRQLPLAVEALQHRDDAVGLWYLGRARFLLAGSLADSNKQDQALTVLDDAQKDFETSMRKNAGFRDSCEQCIAMCLGKKGNVAFASQHLDDAEKWLLAAAKMRPDRIEESLGSGQTTKLGLMRVADWHFRQKDLAKSEAVYRAASDLANGDLDLLNNAGLFARDLGNQLEARGKAEQARQMYEQSYRAYRRAQELDPASVRLRNDCALIAIWHLERDWDLSKQMLDSAIADGERTLREDRPSDRNAVEQLDEAVGDCYENLALWHLKHGEDAAAAKAAAQQSMRHYPGERRPGARRHLQAAEKLQREK
jgi:tetratricopeptide (TPR) repeat protein